MIENQYKRVKFYRSLSKKVVILMDFLYLLSVKTEKKSNKKQAKKSHGKEYLLDFYAKFIHFYQKAIKIPTSAIKFEIMKENFNLGQIETFPKDEEILKLQKSIYQNKANISETKKNWSEDDKKILIWIIAKIQVSKNFDLQAIPLEDWQTVSSMMYRRNPVQCKQQWHKMMKITLHQVPWSKQEDNLLSEIIKSYLQNNQGNKWSAIATELNNLVGSNIHRNGKQCRERWNNYLDPTINRSPWTSDEDLNLLKAVYEQGKKWALISRNLIKPRSENAVKNRFNGLIKRSVKQQGSGYEQTSQGISDNVQTNEEDDLDQAELIIVKQLIEKLEYKVEQEKTQKTPLIQYQDNQTCDSNNRGKYGHFEYNFEMLNSNNLSKGLKDCFQIREERYEDQSKEDLINSLPCLLNLKKGTICRVTFEQLIDNYNLQLGKLSNERSEFDLKLKQIESCAQRINNSSHIFDEFSNQGSLASFGKFLNDQFLKKEEQLHLKLNGNDKQNGGKFIDQSSRYQIQSQVAQMDLQMNPQIQIPQFQFQMERIINRLSLFNLNNNLFTQLPVSTGLSGVFSNIFEKPLNKKSQTEIPTFNEI